MGHGKRSLDHANNGYQSSLSGMSPGLVPILARGVMTPRARIGTRPGDTPERADSYPLSRAQGSVYHGTVAVPGDRIKPFSGVCQLPCNQRLLGAGDLDVALQCFGSDVAICRSPGCASASRRCLYAATLFVSALLLFSIQPMFAKMVLPKLGGAPAVWSVAMVFFQTVLLQATPTPIC